MDVNKYAKCSVYDGSSWDHAGFCYHDVCTIPASLKCAWQLNGEHTDISVNCLLSTQTHRLDYRHNLDWKLHPQTIYFEIFTHKFS